MLKACVSGALQDQVCLVRERVVIVIKKGSNMRAWWKLSQNAALVFNGCLVDFFGDVANFDNERP